MQPHSVSSVLLTSLHGPRVEAQPLMLSAVSLGHTCCDKEHSEQPVFSQSLPSKIASSTMSACTLSLQASCGVVERLLRHSNRRAMQVHVNGTTSTASSAQERSPPDRHFVASAQTLNVVVVGGGVVVVRSTVDSKVDSKVEIKAVTSVWSVDNDVAGGNEKALVGAALVVSGVDDTTLIVVVVGSVVGASVELTGVDVVVAGATVCAATSAKKVKRASKSIEVKLGGGWILDFKKEKKK